MNEVARRDGQTDADAAFDAMNQTLKRLHATPPTPHTAPEARRPRANVKRTEAAVLNNIQQRKSGG